MSNKQQAIDEINALRLYPEFTIEQQDANLWRVNGMYDLYPSTRRIYRTAEPSKFTGWKRGQLLEKIRGVVKNGIVQKSYDLVYFIGIKRAEVIMSGQPYGVCYTEKTKRETSGTYKRGVLRVVPCA